ncbi:uncharacterized protein LOC121864120 isoform X2 [Homarus americanus]|uniref:uncharacterized protein LOC121864120 isoform X2 n=1 Tax=Homarus americanus TaxID=6706 RepID=UPI001C49535A|nr:uncharacterized protein LOC121864120 isoform X2 [Homarus americanus]
MRCIEHWSPWCWPITSQLAGCKHSPLSARLDSSSYYLVSKSIPHDSNYIISYENCEKLETNCSTMSHEESEGKSSNSTDSFTCRGNENGHAKKTNKSSKMDMESLVKAECSERNLHDRLEKFAEEMKWFDLKEDETLIWPFHDNAIQSLAKVDPSNVRRYIKEGLFQRQYSSKNSAKLLVKYLFHVMCSTTDEELRFSAYNTLCYLFEANEPKTNILKDLYKALANLGADVSKLAVNVSDIKSPVIPSSKSEKIVAENSSRIIREILTMLLQLLSIILTNSKMYSENDLDELIFIFLAIGLDPKVIDTSLDSQISTCICHALNLYASDEIFYQRVEGLVEQITSYSEFHHHNVSHFCCMYILPTRRGTILRSSIAFLQAQINLRKEEKILHVIVEVKDLLELIEEQLYVLSEEEDGYILHSVMKLLDCCLGHEPLPATQKKHLQEICDLINPVISGRRDKVDDINPTIFRFYATLVIAKWRRKVDSVGRQQTLHELHANSVRKNGESLLPDVEH